MTPAAALLVELIAAHPGRAGEPNRFVDHDSYQLHVYYWGDGPRWRWDLFRTTDRGTRFITGGLAGDPTDGWLCACRAYLDKVAAVRADKAA